MKGELNPVLLQAELLRLEARHGPALRALLGAIHRVAVGMGRPFGNYHPIQGLARDRGCPNMLPVLTDLELVGVVSRHKGDIHFALRPDWREAGWGQDEAVLSVVRGFLAERCPVRLGPTGRPTLGPDSAPGCGEPDEGGPAGTPATPLGSPELPADLFQDIMGHEAVKELLRAAVLAPKPVHVLLMGPPALAKSLFLYELEAALGERAWWALGSAASRAGIMEVVLERRPYLLLIDELDKMDGRDQAALLSLMEGGRASRTKVGRMADEKLVLRVVAAANDPRRLSPELLSRFALRRIRPYSREEFLGVVRGVLVRREGMEPELAEKVARLLDGRSQDVRDAIRVGRLTPQLGVEKAVELLLGGGE